MKTCTGTRVGVLVALVSLAASSGWSQGTWEAKTPHPTGGGRMSAAGVINDILYLAGGHPPGGTSMRAYDPSTNTWTTKASPSISRAAAAVGVINGKLYVAGGAVQADLNNPTASLEIYNPTTNSWTAGAAMPSPRGQLASAVINGKLYVAGGQGRYPYPAMNLLHIYDPATNTWSAGAPMPVPVGGAIGADMNGKLVVAGGATNSSPSRGGDLPVATLQVYDPATNSWSLLAPMTTARASLAGGVAGGMLIVTGGVTQVGSVASVVPTMEIYNPATNTWSFGPSQIKPRFQTSCATTGNDLYVAGGLDAAFQDSGFLEVFHMSVNQSPVAKCAAVVVAAGEDGTAEASIDDGSYDPEGGAIATLQDPAGPYGYGVTQVTLYVQDSSGLISQCQSTVTVTDEAAPVPTLGSLPSLEGMAPFTVTTVPTATDNVAGLVQGTTTDPLTYTQAGTFTITWTYTDGAGNQSSQTQSVTVIAPDVTPPVFNALVPSTAVLWPPNHQLVPVQIAGQVTDDSGDPVTVRVIAINSNEPQNGLGDGDTDQDWQITSELALLLRAERAGKGGGRIYSITVQATDSSGNSSTATTQVMVPKSMGRR